MIDEEKQLFPFCIVWTTLPCISWLIPLIGHVGICSSEGVVNDFLGYHINKKNMAFGRPLKYVNLYPTNAEQYNDALAETNKQFSSKGHNLCSNNCHHHVADVLNRLNYEGKQDWSQLSIWWMCVSRSSYVNNLSIFKIYLPFLLLVGLLIVLVYLLKQP